MNRTILWLGAVTLICALTGLGCPSSGGKDDCGDGVCQEDETCTSCEEDCGPCGPVCVVSV